MPETASSVPSESGLRKQEESTVQKVEKPYTIAKVLGALAIIFAIGGFVFGIQFGEPVLIGGFSICGGCAIIAIVLAIVTAIRVKLLHAEYDTKVEKLKILKGLLLNKKLTEYGFEKIADHEKIDLDLLDVDLEDDNFDFDSFISDTSTPGDLTKAKPKDPK